MGFFQFMRREENVEHMFPHATRTFFPYPFLVFLFIGATVTLSIAYATAILSTVSVVQITTSTAQITWVTDVLADSSVSYTSNSTAYISGGTSCDSGGLVLQHCILLSNLTPATQYQFVVTSCATGATCIETKGTFTTLTPGASGGISNLLPAAPSNFHNVVTNVSLPQFTLAWTDNSSNEDSFILNRKLSSEPNWPTTPLVTLPANATAYDDSNLLPQTSYDYSIASCRANYGCSAAVSLNGLVTPASPDATPPTAPVRLATTKVTDTEVDLLWSPATDNVGVIMYKVFRGDSTVPLAILTNPSTNTMYVDSSLTPNTTYVYTVRAYDAAGLESPAAGPLSVTTLASSSGSGNGGGSPSTHDVTPPSAPSGLIATKNVFNEVGLSWTQSTDNVGVSGYLVSRSGTNGVWTTFPLVSNNAYSDRSVLAGTPYYYIVTAIDAAQNTSASSGPLFLTTQVATTTAGTPPTAAQISKLGSAAVGATSANITWMTDLSTDGAVYYGISTGSGTSYASTSRTMCPATLSTALSTNHCIVLTNLVPETKYFLRVASLNGVGLTTISSEYSFTTTALASTTTTTKNSSQVDAQVVLGLSRCVGGISFTPLTISSTPPDKVTVHLFTVAPTPSERLLVPGTYQIENGSYRWEAVPSAGFSLSGKTAADFDLSYTCPQGDPQTATMTPATAPASTTQPFTPISVGSGKIAATNTLPILLLPSTQSAGTSSPNKDSTSTVASIATVEQFTSYCSSTSSKDTCLSFANVVVGSNVIASTSLPITVKTFAQLETGTVSLPGDATTPEELRAVCAQEKFVSSCTKLFVTSGLATEAEAKKIASNIALKDVATDNILSSRVGARAYLDTDGDTITDYDEINIYHTDPKKKDTNNDGVTDGAQILAGTDPLSTIPPSGTTTTNGVTNILIDILSRAEQKRIPYEDPKFAGNVRDKVLTVTSISALPATLPASGTSTATSSIKVKLGGKALPNSFVTLFIYSEPIVVTIKTDASGEWVYTLDHELSDGHHEVYSAITDVTGRILAKSEPLPFVKQASAVSIASPLLLPNTNVAPGFFSGNSLYVLLTVLVLIVGVAILVIGVITRGSVLRRGDSAQH
jgi:fibronectin type 3 domain-containing protein